MTQHLLVALLAAASFGANAELHRFDTAGTVRIGAAAARPATLNTLCSPDPKGGALSIELVVPEANTRKDFDYDDFEGPDAVAGDKVPAHLAWASASAKTEITHPVGGWYAPEPPESFIFGISQLSHRREAAARLLGAVGEAAGTLTWSQGGYTQRERALSATFELDAATAKRLHAAVASCLPPAGGTKR
jgi:hypothetical protein